MLITMTFVNKHFLNLKQTSFFKQMRSITFARVKEKKTTLSACFCAFPPRSYSHDLISKFKIFETMIFRFDAKTCSSPPPSLSFSFRIALVNYARCEIPERLSNIRIWLSTNDCDNPSGRIMLDRRRLIDDDEFPENAGKRALNVNKSIARIVQGVDRWRLRSEYRIKNPSNGEDTTMYASQKIGRIN